MSTTTPTDTRQADAPIVSARGLTKAYDAGDHPQCVLRGLDVDIHRSDFTVIMGPSGSGKSTLLHALAGLDRPSGGTVTFDGKDITAMGDDDLAVFRRHACGFVFQQHQLLDGMSLMDNAIVAGALTMRSKRDIIAKARTLFTQVGLDERTWQRAATQVSGGEAQRASVVRALVNDPALVFADEPTGALNSHHAQAVLDVFTRLHHRGQGIVMVTHDRHSALRGSRILYLRDGAIVDECRPGTYTADGGQGRERALSDFLERMGW
ncbi:ABC transporter ATP-binding protein [Bifidobacterium cuniculi]|uniref:ABC transporter, ATP-binding protein n=1 Tax=Bifidobacterium cuniculi TaxID=1688 RepID=A0A087B4B2_9BIFI|nr:ABC transporter ATP-binding protein [Bifidobacterium cuniculi]KFI65862.1 ABC transporter, ATP-binding protein [Bifidobacterium cuniculi]